MLLQVLPFLIMLYALHDRSYYSYRPFFHCCARPFDEKTDADEKEDVTDSRENKTLQHPFGTPFPTPASAEDTTNNDADVVREKSDVRRLVDSSLLLR